MNEKRSVKPHFLSIEEKQAISEDVEKLAKKYSLKRIKLECSGYKMIYQAQPKHANTDSLLILTSYRPKMKIQGVMCSPKVGPGASYATEDEAFDKLTIKVKKRFRDNRDKWSDEKKIQRREYHQKWREKNQDKLEAYKLKRRQNK